MKLPIQITKFHISIAKGFFQAHIVIYYSTLFLKAIFSGIILAFIFAISPNLISLNDNKLIVSNPHETPYVNQNIPTNISIPVLNFEMDIREATVSANDWQVFDDAVSWLNVSGDLQKGNIVLYAHNQKNQFGKIIRLGIGSKIILKNNSTTREYIVSKVLEVPRDRVDLLNNTENRLTMYTCSGWFDAKRFFVIANPQN